MADVKEPAIVYDREPDCCAGCQSQGIMELMTVDIDGQEAEAFICDGCGYSHFHKWAESKTKPAKITKFNKVRRSRG